MSRQLFEYHAVIGYRFIPNLKARVAHEGGGYLVRTNESGFRADRPFNRERSPALRRALLFGDSFTAGDAVSNGERYSDLLEAAIPRLEIYNYGLPGTGTDQQYLAWREFAQGVEHDVVVIAVLVENIRRILSRYRAFVDGEGTGRIQAKPYFVLEAGELRLRGVPPRREPFPKSELAPDELATVEAGGRFRLIREAARAVGAREVLQRITRYQPVPEYDSPQTPGWQLMRAILGEWVRAIGRNVLLVPVPLYQYVEETSDATPCQARFAELAKELGCELHDPLPDLLRYSPAERRAFRFRSDIHPTPAAHAALAASLKPSIERMLDQGARQSRRGAPA